MRIMLWDPFLIKVSLKKKFMGPINSARDLKKHKSHRNALLKKKKWIANTRRECSFEDCGSHKQCTRPFFFFLSTFMWFLCFSSGSVTQYYSHKHTLNLKNKFTLLFYNVGVHAPVKGKKKKSNPSSQNI